MKKNFSLIAAISIPILMILFIAASIYLPALFIKPKFNFVYEMPYPIAAYPAGAYPGAASGYPSGYTVENGKLVNFGTGTSTALYLYTVSDNTSEQISYSQASTLTLDPNISSSDGFQVVHGGYDDGFFPFGGGGDDYNSFYLTGHNVSKKLNIQPQAGDYANSNFTFLGWVTGN